MSLASRIPDPADPASNTRNPAALALSLNAISALYGGAVGLRNAAYDRFPSLSHEARFPVVSIGGIRAGGSGKTPVAAMIGERLTAAGRTVAFLSRGYRRQDTRCRIVRPGEKPPWQLIGDEPALLHNRLPQSWLGIDKDRCKSASILADLMPGRPVFILDDGFQHRSIRREIDVVCLHRNFFDDRIIPAGYLREPVSSLRRAQIALLIGTAGQAGSLQRQRERLAAAYSHLQTAVVIQRPGCWVNAGTGEKNARPPLDRPALLCGIARPARFTAMVRECGITTASEHLFSDHHPFGREFFVEHRELLAGGIVTTEKDAVRLAGIDVVPASNMWYLTIELLFTDSSDQARVFSLIEAV